MHNFHNIAGEKSALFALWSIGKVDGVIAAVEKAGFKLVGKSRD
ncbi:MAG: hypothetical protein V7L29_16165 [Nostoc sp.]